MKKTKISAIIILLFCYISIQAVTVNKNDTTVCYSVSMDCMACKQKIEKNIAFEKGVKALVVNLNDKTVKVTYNKLKNNPKLLKEAIEKLKYEVKIIAVNK